MDDFKNENENNTENEQVNKVSSDNITEAGVTDISEETQAPESKNTQTDDLRAEPLPENADEINTVDIEANVDTVPNDSMPENAENSFDPQSNEFNGGHGYNQSGNFSSYNQNNSNTYVPNFSYSEPRPQKVKNRGIKVFCVALALVLIVTLSVSAGYLASEYRNTSSSGSTKSTAPSISLQERPDSDTESAKNFSKVFNNVQKSVVNILVYSPTSQTESGSASGVIYSKDGYIVTNDHIYDGVAKAKFLVRLYNGKEYKASYVAGDVRSDLAVIKLDEKVSGLVPATFGNSSDVLIGEEVITVGYPSSYGDEATLTHGIISAVNRRVTSTSTNYASSFLQTDATINPGNSGGALSNMFGQIIGITSSKLAGDAYDAVSYAIPTTTMKRVITGLISKGYVNDRAKLGITYTSIDTLTAEASSIPVGVCIGSISSECSLSKSFTKGDIITHVNGKEITSSVVLLNVIENSKPGDAIELTIYKLKSKTSKTVSVKLLADKGSSSYTEKETTSSGESIPFNFGKGDSSDSSSDNSSSGSKTFDFPLN